MKFEKEHLYLVVAFLATYLVFNFIIAPLLSYDLESPTYWLIPIPAFFLAYWMPEFFDESAKTLLHKPVVVPIFAVLAFTGWWLATWIYFFNISLLGGQGYPGPVGLLLSSSYLSVMVFGIAALGYKQLAAKISTK